MPRINYVRATDLNFSSSPTTTALDLDCDTPASSADTEESKTELVSYRQEEITG